MGGAGNKLFLKIGEKTVLEYTLEAFFESPETEEIVITAAEDEKDRIGELFKNAPKKLTVVTGGATRQESVKNGIAAANGDILLIHDGARALITPELIKDVADACKRYGAAALGVPVKDTLKLVRDDGVIEKTIDRSRVYQVQTPQAFFKDLIKTAHDKAKDNSATDDCALIEALGVDIKMVAGSYENIKLTTPEDMTAAEAILKKRGKI